MTPVYFPIKLTPLRIAAMLFALQSLIAIGCCGCPVWPPQRQIIPKPPDSAKDKKVVPDKDGIGAGPIVVPPLPAGRRYALLVGVTQYRPDSPGLEDLSYPDDDVRALAEVLVKKGYRQEDVIVLCSSAGKGNAPTKELIWAELEHLVKKCGPDDLLLVALSGHGHQPPKATAHFCPYRGNIGDLKSLVSVDRVAEKMAKAPGMNVLLVDACRNGTGARAVKREFGEGFDVIAQPNAPSVLTLYSCSHRERSWEVDDLHHGLFFDLLIRGLNGEADDHPDGHVTWTELVGFVQREMPNHGKKYRKVQTPHFRGETAKQLPLAVFTPVAANKANQLVHRTIRLDRQLASWNERLTIKLVSIEFRNDRKMRWNFSFYNVAGKPLRSAHFAFRAYVTDQNGKRSDYLASKENAWLTLPDGQNLAFSVDFQEPVDGAHELTAHFPNSDTGLPTSIVVSIVPGNPATNSQPDEKKAESLPNTKIPPTDEKGRLVLQSSSKVQKGNMAWIEIDGVKAAVWPVGNDQVLVDNVTPGNRQVTVYSIPKGGKRLTIYNKQVTVNANETLRIDVGP